VVAVALARSSAGADPRRLPAGRARLPAGRPLGLPVLSLVDTPGAEPGTEAEEGGHRPGDGRGAGRAAHLPLPDARAGARRGRLGGALAAAAADRVLVTPDAYFAAIGPEGRAGGAAAPAQECADLMRVTPRDLLPLGAPTRWADPRTPASHLGRRVAPRPAATRRGAGRAAAPRCDRSSCDIRLTGAGPG
jgi:acetyl-CoA carboxylase carboxyl transferase subunit beta